MGHLITGIEFGRGSISIMASNTDEEVALEEVRVLVEVDAVLQLTAALCSVLSPLCGWPLARLSMKKPSSSVSMRRRSLSGLLLKWSGHR